MTRSEQRIFEARMDSLPIAVAFVEAFCELQGAAAPDALRLTLIIEELFTNTIVHGHGGDHTSPVRIEVAIGPTQMSLRYEDCAPPFNPLQYLQEAHPDLDTHVDERRVGGLGLPLVAQMVEQFDYAHVDGFNCLLLVLKRDA
jgi:anti-sigma regulatory factor (Ser/Thr protein kinase)